MTATTDPKSRRPARVVGAVIVLAFVVFLGYEISPWFHYQVLVSVSRRPTPFTELYFADHTELPKHLSLHQPNEFSFVIVNHEARTVNYLAHVTLQGPRGSTLLADDNLRISSGQARQENVQFVPGQAGITYLVMVQLVGQPEFLHFSAQT